MVVYMYICSKVCLSDVTIDLGHILIFLLNRPGSWEFQLPKKVIKVGSREASWESIQNSKPMLTQRGGTVGK